MRRALLAAAAACATCAQAGDFGSIRDVPQSALAAITENLGAAIAYRGVTPATPLGLTGFDVGIEATATKIADRGAFRVAGTDVPAQLVLPKLHVHKGLWGGLDVGAFVAGASQVDVRVAGAELRYALLDDGLATPAVGIRVSGSRAFGTGDLKLSTLSLDGVVSKRFTAITPYAGAGVVRMQGRVDGTPLAEETPGKSRIFGGVNLNLLTVNLAFEAERLGDITSLSAKVGFRF